jgi:hypothetical protein
MLVTQFWYQMFLITLPSSDGVDIISQENWFDFLKGHIDLIHFGEEI